jgi:serine/threonine-protein phosphatase 5
LLLLAKKYFEKQDSLININFSSQQTMTVCGDIHGQYLDLLNIFECFGHPSPDHFYLFNGDFVDRGPASMQCILTLIAYKILYPDSFFMSRGNHESSHVNKLYGFEADVKKCYGEDDHVFTFFQQLFDTIPLCHVIQNKIFVNLSFCLFFYILIGYPWRAASEFLFDA